MSRNIGVKPANSSIISLKKELLFFDEIHFFGDSAAWSLAEILIPDNIDIDPILAVKNALKEVEILMQTGKTENKLLEQVFTDYHILSELGIVKDQSEHDVIKPALKHRKKFKTISKTGITVADEFNDMNHLIILMHDWIKTNNKSNHFKSFEKGKNLSEISLEGLFDKDVKWAIENEQLIRELSSETIARLYSFVMNMGESGRYVPILDKLSDWKNKPVQNQSDSLDKFKVINAVINSLPMPNINTPLEEVLDFKKDSEAQGLILGLNNWIVEASTKNLSSVEIEDKLEYLLFEYNKFIKINKIKFAASKLEIIVTSTAEIVENIVKLKFSKVAQKLFQFYKTDVSLLEAEMNAPGKEVAYISTARERFKN